LGDVIHAIPTAAALRARFPEARIDWMVDPRYVPLLEMVRGLDSRIAVNTRRVGSTFATLRDLRGVGYSAVIDLQGLLKSAVLARAVGAERTIGFARHHLRERTAGPFYTDRVDPTEPHVIFKNLALLAPLGSRDTRVAFPLEIPYSTVAETTMARFAERRTPSSIPALPGPTTMARRSLRRPCRHVERSVRAAVAGALGTRRAAAGGACLDCLARAPPSRRRPRRSPISFAIARRARILISGDTGPLHIGGAVGHSAGGPLWTDPCRAQRPLVRH
jgi:ADP-heptose:LPS heptosyltransferase